MPVSQTTTLYVARAVKSQEGFVINSACSQSLSRGTVKISDLNIRKKPIIDPNYVGKAEDILYNKSNKGGGRGDYLELGCTNSLRTI
ncbi:neither inactivation nor afterpotential protein G-like isoform 3-T3 [Glossina fuscipes fuscipes]